MINLKDYYLDKKLHIQTGGIQSISEATVHYHRYEPTPYKALHQLFQEFPLSPNDRIIDFGCGKGRLNIYSHYLFGAGGEGVEMNGQFHQQAMDNLYTYSEKLKQDVRDVSFVCTFAEEYEIGDKDNYFYFFNPFSVEIFRKVIDNIRKSIEKNKREIRLIFYYPDNEYVYYLAEEHFLTLEKEIILPEHKKDEHEKFLVYRLGDRS